MTHNPMADTSELLPSTDDAPVVDVLTAVAQCAAAWEPGARLLGNVRACDILRAVTHAKSRLQAEAQAPTVTLEQLSDSTFVHMNILRGTIKLTREQALHIAGESAAQAPTTAASVLTEQEQKTIERINGVLRLGGYINTAIDFDELIDRLTVGVPAPAPDEETFTREHILLLIDAIVGEFAARGVVPANVIKMREQFATGAPAPAPDEHVESQLRDYIQKHPNEFSPAPTSYIDGQPYGRRKMDKLLAQQISKRAKGDTP